MTRFLQEAPLPEPRPPVKEFQIPKELPGAEAPQLVVPERDLDTPFEKHREEVRKIYKPLPKLPQTAFSPQQADAQPISLTELERLAYENSPVIAAARARVEKARGQAIQAGLYPNPTAGYLADTINTGDTDGLQGVFASQTLVTADKLEIRQSVEWQEVVKAEYSLRRAEIDLATRVRRNTAGALIAQERLKLAALLADLFRRAYEAQIDLVAGGETAGYEPLQLRVFAVQAQNEFIEAGNGYVAAWRGLAAELNLPGFGPRTLDLSPEMPLPDISHDQALDLLLSRHTDLAIAFTQITKSQWNVNLQRVTPIPNVDLMGAALHDDTSVKNDMAFNVQIGLQLPFFNRNQGNIYQAESELVEAHQEQTSAANRLAADLAEIYARYRSQKALARNYHDEILPDLVRTYRGIYGRFREGADPVDFAEIVVTQQQLGQATFTYLDVLEAEWQALVDLAEILQADDMFHLEREAASLQNFPNGEILPIPAEPTPVQR